MPLRPCLDCRTPTQHTRCRRCEARRQAARNQTRPHYRGTWPRTSKQIRDAWIAEHGWTCPGWETTPPHPSTDLVVDHATPRDPTRLQVLCRNCNSRKSATERRPH